MNDLSASCLRPGCACPSVNPGCPPCLPSLLCLPSITFARPAYPACRACCALFVVLTPPVEAHLPVTHMLRSTHEPRRSLTKPLCAKAAYADTARHAPPSKYVILAAMMCANEVRQQMARHAPWRDMSPMSSPSLLAVCLAHGIENLLPVNCKHQSHSIAIVEEDKSVACLLKPNPLYTKVLHTKRTKGIWRGHKLFCIAFRVSFTPR